MTTCKVTFGIVEEGDSSKTYGVVGNVDQLGNWDIDNSVILTKGDKNLHKVTINLEKDAKINYRFFEARKVNNRILVDAWESMWDYRKFQVPDCDEYNEESCCVFGMGYFDKNCSQGWLTTQSKLYLNFSNCKEKLMLKNNKCDRLKFSVTADNAISSKQVKLTPTNCDVLSSLEFDIPKDSNEYNYTVFEFWKDVGLTCNIYATKENGQIGAATISTSMIQKSNGTFEIPLVFKDGKHITINVGYLIAHPFTNMKLKCEESNNKWNRSKMLLVGHRGCGNSFTSEHLSNYRENSIESFKKVSDQQTNAFVEFDVHLTKDDIPIVYHDLTTCLHTLSTDGKINLAELPVCQLRLDELQQMKTYHKARKVSNRILEFDQDDFKVNPPFPTLADVLQDVPQFTGFNIELKYPVQSINGRWEDGLTNYKDANLFIDQVLDVVFKYCSDREIIFSSFDADICTLARQKQNRFPVCLLTNGNTDHYVKMMDVRQRSNEMAIAYAKSEGFLGITSLENDFEHHPEIITKAHQCGLLIGFYGDNVSENLVKFDEKLVDVAIYDRIHKVKYRPNDRSKKSEET